MSILAFNALYLQSIKGKYQILFGALPVFSIFSVVLTFMYLISYLEKIHGIPLFNLTYKNPDGWLWISVLVVFIVFLSLIGYSIGWILNALLIKSVLNWPNQKINSVFLHSGLPDTWIKPDLVFIKNTQELQRAILARQINLGMTRFVLIRAIAVGSPLFIIPALVDGNPLNHFIRALIFGIAFGFICWSTTKQEYIKQNTSC